MAVVPWSGYRLSGLPNRVAELRHCGFRVLICCSMGSVDAWQIASAVQERQEIPARWGRCIAEPLGRGLLLGRLGGTCSAISACSCRLTAPRGIWTGEADTACGASGPAGPATVGASLAVRHQ